MFKPRCFLEISSYKSGGERRRLMGVGLTTWQTSNSALSFWMLRDAITQILYMRSRMVYVHIQTVFILSDVVFFSSYHT